MRRSNASIGTQSSDGLVLGFRKSFHLAVQAIDRTILLLVCMTLKLNSAMPYTVFLTQHCFQSLQNSTTLTYEGIVNEHMTGERSHPTRNSPDMQIMHILYSCYPFHIGDQLWHINAFRYRFKQNIRCLPHNTPSPYSNEM